MRGRFTPGANDDEWCERRLLARIHGYTVKRLRAEIEPVAARDFLRFLLAWQRVAPDAPDARSGRGRGRGRAARGLRGAGRRLGKRNPAGADRRIRAFLARRSMPGRTDILGQAAAARPQDRRRGSWRHARAHDAHRASRAPQRPALVVALTRHRCRRAQQSCPDRRRLHPRAWRLLLRRVGRGHRPAAYPDGGCAGRVGRFGAGEFRQFRRLARASDALGPAPALRRRQAAPAHRDLRHGRRRPLGAHPPPRRRPARRSR